MKTTQFKNSIIRFAEFSEKLTLTSLNEISIFKKGKGLSKEEVSKQGIYDCILYGELFTKYSNTINEIFSKTNTYYNVKSTENDILVPASSTSINYLFPFVSITKSNVILGSDINIFTINNQNLNTYIALLFTKYENNKNIFRYSEGSTINHLYGRYILKYKITITANKSEQTKIANFFTLLDKQIQLIDRKLELYELKKKYYLNNMFCDDKSNFPRLRFTQFKADWSKLKILDLLSYEQPTKYIVNSSEYSNDFEIPVLTANKQFILGYTNEKTNIYNKIPSIIFDDFTTDFKYVDFPFKIKSSAIKILKPKGDNSLFFIHNLWQKNKFNATGHNRHYISIIQETTYFIPSVEEQEKIANFFLLIDKNIENIKKQKVELIKRKTYYLNNMFV